jgi:hypothetical protein
MSIVVKNRASEPDHLRITEIFLSIQGEAAQVGWPTVFVRLTGCPSISGATRMRNWWRAPGEKELSGAANPAMR